MFALAPLLAVLVAFGLYVFYKRWQNQALRNKPFPAHWLAFVESRLPIYSKLTLDEQSQLRQRIKFFVDRKEFYGCAGLTITDEIRVTIAAEACLLLLNKKRPVYPGLTAILVYPTAFKVEREQHQSDGTVASSAHGMLGESWNIELKQTPDILSSLDKTDIKTIAFKAEMDSHNGLSNAKSLLEAKHVDAVCYNLLYNAHSFGTSDNEITFITKEAQIPLGKADKLTLSNRILTQAKELIDA